jgi:thiol-disulfide isomerase/thioredoxin
MSETRRALAGILDVQVTAAWCGPCQQELPHLLALHERYCDRGLQVLAIAVGDDIEALPEFIQRKGTPWRVAPASASDPVLAAYPVVGVPNLVALDGDGIVRALDVRASAQGVQIKEMIESMLEGSPS